MSFVKDNKQQKTPCILFHSENLKIVREIKDRTSEGRTCGSLGNAYYLMENGDEASKFHNQVGPEKKYKNDNASMKTQGFLLFWMFGTSLIIHCEICCITDFLFVFSDLLLQRSSVIRQHNVEHL